MSDETKRIYQRAQVLKGHIFLCVGESCCADSLVDVQKLWKHLKKATAHTQILRSKTTCLRVCHSGPILLVYPQGLWIEFANKAKIDRVIDILQNPAPAFTDLVKQELGVFLEQPLDG